MEEDSLDQKGSFIILSLARYRTDMKFFIGKCSHLILRKGSTKMRSVLGYKIHISFSTMLLHNIVIVISFNIHLGFKVQ